MKISPSKTKPVTEQNRCHEQHPLPNPDSFTLEDKSYVVATFHLCMDVTEVKVVLEVIPFT